MKWAEFEDTSTLCSLYRMVKIDSVDNANEPDSERKASRERTKDVTKKPNSLRWVQLRCSHFFLPVVHGDGRPSSSAQIANPVNVAPGGPDPTPAQDLDDRQRRGAGQAALPAADGNKPIEAQRNASSQKELEDCAEDPNPPWHPSGAHNSIAHFITHPCLDSFGLPHRQTHKKAIT